MSMPVIEFTGSQSFDYFFTLFALLAIIMAAIVGAMGLMRD